MMNSRSNAGFTLIEVMLSMAIMGLILTPIYVLQGNVTERVYRMGSRMRSLFYAQDILYQARRAQPPAVREFSFAQKDDNEQLQAEYRLSAISEKSALAKTEHLLKEEIKVRDARFKRETTMVRFVYKKPLPEKKA